MQGKAMLMPAVWGGLAIGILSALPIVGALNLCCCLWVVTGGLLASYILQSNTDAPIAIGDSTIVGLMSGLVGAFVYGFISIPVNLLMGPLQQRAMSRLADVLPNLPPEVRDALSSAGSAEMVVAGAVMGFVAMLLAGAIFATAGGLLGYVFFRKKPEPVPPPDYPVAN
jgi:hypothetical protein